MNLFKFYNDTKKVMMEGKFDNNELKFNLAKEIIVNKVTDDKKVFYQYLRDFDLDFSNSVNDFIGLDDILTNEVALFKIGYVTQHRGPLTDKVLGAAIEKMDINDEDGTLFQMATHKSFPQELKMNVFLKTSSDKHLTEEQKEVFEF